MKIVAIMGKSGSGKDSLTQRIEANYYNNFNKLISCTTRPPRGGENNGIDYYFISEEEFLNKIKNGEMLEYMQFNGWYYGTDFANLSEEKVNVGVFSPEGVRNLGKKENIDLRVYYLVASDKIRLLRQLDREKEPDVREIIRRFSTDENDFEDLSDIDYTELKNEDFQDFSLASQIIVEENI